MEKTVNRLLYRILEFVERRSRSLRLRVVPMDDNPASQPTSPVRSLPVLRCGIVGLGTMGHIHRRAISESPCFALVAISSTSRDSEGKRPSSDCRFYPSPDEMLAAEDLDVVFVCTPHPEHESATIKALDAGCHVVCEKPLSITPGSAKRIQEAAGKSGRLVTTVFQSRFEVAYRRIHSILQSGELGQIRRCEMVEACWRSDSYYRAKPWRGTWQGEGGGVTMNQAPHVLDRYLWLIGAPTSIAAYSDTQIHPISVEDSVSAILRHESGIHGFIHVNTCDPSLESRLSISCDKGRISLQNGILTVETLPQSTREYSRMSNDDFAGQNGEAKQVRAPICGDYRKLLPLFYSNLAHALAGEAPIEVSILDAVGQVDLGCAMLLSSARGRSVEFPVDAVEYDAFLQERYSEHTDTVESEPV